MCVRVSLTDVVMQNNKNMKILHKYVVDAKLKKLSKYSNLSIIKID